MSGLAVAVKVMVDRSTIFESIVVVLCAVVHHQARVQ